MSHEYERSRWDRFRDVVLVIVVVVLIFLLLYIFFPDVVTETNGSVHSSPTATQIVPTSMPPATATPPATTIALVKHYKTYYPNIWDYISKHSEDPYSYIIRYDAIWGDLKICRGDEVVFEQLSALDQKYINYPNIGQYVYFQSGDSTYHSTKDCYILLGQSTSMRLAKFADNYIACDKCVSVSERVTPTPEPTPQPTVSIYNGKRIITSDYVSTCPLTLIADTDADYYIYLQYLKAPHYSAEPRKLSPYARPPYEADIAFIVSAGYTVSLDVPIGVYKLYYATGKDFYGPTQLFGDSTKCFEAEGTLSFYLSGEYYQGHTITLYPTYDGNMDTDQIPETAFPTR